jgi:hypothetical protein
MNNKTRAEPGKELGKFNMAAIRHYAQPVGSIYRDHGNINFSSKINFSRGQHSIT